MEHYLTNYHTMRYDFVAFPAETFLLYACKLLKYLIGPLLYFVYRMMIDRDYPRGFTLYLCHCMPAVAACAALTVSGFGVQNGLLDPATAERLLSRIDSGAMIHMFAYGVYMIREIIRLFAGFQDEVKRQTRLFIVIVASVSGAIFLLILFLVTDVRGIETAALVTISAVMILLVFDERFRPVLMKNAAREMRKIRYARSLLHGIDTNLLRERIMDIMDEKLYCDEDLTLNRMALILGITPHQLSEYINTHEKVNFNTFINRYRIDEAKKMLSGPARWSVLSVAFAVGFNSKDAFYRAFSDSVGMSPGEYRRSTTGRAEKLS
jgi:AraC-like DNA-binding protein